MANLKQKIQQEARRQILVCLVVFLLVGGLICSGANSSENFSKGDNLAKIESGFFVSKNDVYGLEDEGFREKLLLFLTEEGILSKSLKGLIYYHISEEAISKIEDPEFKEKVENFVTMAEGEKTSPQKDLGRVHEVQPGETLWNIAQRYGMSVDEILRLNRLKSSETIYPGQKS